MRKQKEKKFCMTCRIRIKDDLIAIYTSYYFRGGPQYVEYEEGYKCVSCETKFRK